MVRQYAVALVAGLSLVGCGGGGGGGSDGGPKASTGVSAQDLVGSWVRIEKTYDLNAQNAREALSSTFYDTITMTQQGSGLSHRNCVSEDVNSATLSNKELNVGMTTLTVVDKDTLTFQSERREIEYRRKQTSDNVGVSNFALSLPLPAPFPSNVTINQSNWTELCASSKQFESDSPIVQFKGKATVRYVQDIGVTLGLTFTSLNSSQIELDTYAFPNLDLGVAGMFDVPVQELGGELSNPSDGTVTIASTSGRASFALSDLTMDSEIGEVEMSGQLSLPATWLEL